jgi:hypothetical protein
MAPQPTQQIRFFCTSHDGARIAYALAGSGPPIVKAFGQLNAPVPRLAPLIGSSRYRP